MSFTVKDLKEMIKELPDELPVKGESRYYDRYVLTDILWDDDSLCFEVGYECDAAWWLRE